MPFLPVVASIISLLSGFHYEVGRFSHYAPNDGHNGGELACGGQYTHEQEHIAYRKWYRKGCGSYVLVYSADTGKLNLTTIQDGGPYGIYKGHLRDSFRKGNWAVYTGATPPAGWRWRGLIDASYGLWVALDKPAFLSRVHVVHAPRWLSRALARSRYFASI